MSKKDSSADLSPQEDYTAKLQKLKEGLDKANNLRIQAETRLEELSKQEKELIQQIKSYGVEPDELDNYIERLQEEIESLISEIEQTIPWDLIKSSAPLSEREE
ncbi:MAG: hypothetical protein K9L17_01235 [Clostridiales bacterium]|nr:hypothetical protein [Clostridiales bacterium]MCF8021315.1 hypothetical protein [Clostridiales bacterium]